MFEIEVLIINYSIETWLSLVIDAWVVSRAVICVGLTEND